MLSLGIEGYTQTEPALPSPCLNNGNSKQNNMIVTGTTTFTIKTLTDFSS